MSTISDVYYDGLGVDNPQDYKRFAIYRLDEYRYYLKNAVRRNRQHGYSYSFTVYGAIGKIIEPEADIPDPFSIELYTNSDLKTKVRSVKEKREIQLGPQDIGGQVYGRFGDKIIAYDYTIEGYLIEQIEPYNLPEDEEDEAMDLLFNSGEAFGTNEDSKFRRNPIDFKLRDIKKRRAIIGSMPASPVLWLRLRPYIFEKQQEAIETLCVRPRPHHRPLLDLLQRGSYTDWKSVDQTFPEDDDFLVLTDGSRSGCTEQREFVRKAMGTPDFAILEGPPGSGKTTALLELVVQEVMKGKRVLMVASTHVAVDNIIERLVKKRDIKGKKQSLITACGIIPIRIGDEGNVSEDARPYCLNRFVETEKVRITKCLREQKLKSGLSPAQEGLYRSLVSDSKKADEYIRQLVIECANFVCGTNIGVLQAPMIKQSISAEKLFDIVILDEASKTTFQEFLVPALYGERWILSGDVRQLAPYVDAAPILHNLRAIPAIEDKTDREICINVFRASKWSENWNRPVILVNRDDDSIIDYCDRIDKQIKGLDRIDTENRISYASVTKAPTTNEKKFKIFGANLLVVSKFILPRIENILPPWMDNPEQFSARYRRRAEAVQNEGRSERQKWEEAIQWRICRMQEIDPSSEKYRRYENEVKALLPYFESSNKHGQRNRNDVVEDEINHIKSIALPSILSLLQKGFTGSNMPSDAQNIALYAGLDYNGIRPEILQDRHTLLTYQHRMHPEISEFPRKYIYGGKALEPAAGLESLREWPRSTPFPNYTSRVVWIDINPSKKELGTGRSRYNRAEIRVIVDKLKTFMQWSKLHERTDENKGEKWIVAIISFYKGQSKKITEEIRKLKKEYHLEGDYDDFSSDHYNVTIKICTVDRFQGQEADIVFLSFVRVWGQGIGFLDNVNRLNVAITRAKYQLIITGDRQLYKKARDADVLNKLAEITPSGELYYARGE